MDNHTPPTDFPTTVNEAIPEKPESSLTQPIKAGAIIKEIVQTLILAVVLYFMIDFVVARVRVENVSMKPTLQPGEFLLVNKLTYKFSPMARGDVVVFHYPPQPSEDYIKRLIGLPGDTVLIENGNVVVNKQKLVEPYISAPPGYSGEWQVPAGAIFVLGDNRNSSSDSHVWGFVPIENLMGKAIVIYWPLNNAKVLRHSTLVSAIGTGAP